MNEDAEVKEKKLSNGKHYSSLFHHPFEISPLLYYSRDVEKLRVKTKGGKDSKRKHFLLLFASV